MTKVAIVVGGSERVWSDVGHAKIFCIDHNVEPEFYLANDMIEFYHGHGVACTLHPDKLFGWLKQRSNEKLPPLQEVWSHNGGDSNHRPNSCITHRLTDWGGSVGMFSYQVARARGRDRVILCGVPMTMDNHFVRGVRWTACPAFMRSWENRREEMAPYVRSMSGGWTEELFGKPDAKWITGETVL